MNEPLKVLLVDDHEVVRIGLRQILERRPELTVVGEAGTAAEAVEAARTYRPDVVVMDVRLPDGTGIEACREIRSERTEVKVIMLTSYADDDAAFASILAGAAGFLLKQTRGQVLADAIVTVGRGGSLLDPVITQRIVDRVRTGGSPVERAASLTEQERRILELISMGKTNREIARELFLSEKTVRNYVSNILHKLNVTRRAEAAAVAARLRPQRGPGDPTA